MPPARLPAIVIGAVSAAPTPLVEMVSEEVVTAASVVGNFVAGAAAGVEAAAGAELATTSESSVVGKAVAGADVALVAADATGNGAGSTLIFASVSC